MSIIANGPIVLVGAGRMGTALLSGWLARGADPKSIFVQEPQPSAELAELLSRQGMRAEPDLKALPAAPAVIVAAVKPQSMDAVFPQVSKLVGRATVVMSIAAGKSIASFETHLPAGTAVVRAMPNTPAAIGRGMTGAVANMHASEAQRQLCQTLLGAVGEVVWISDEAQIDAVTAVSGSGPAYVFLLAETLAKAGETAGLDAQTAVQLARATVSGAGELLRQSHADIATLRQNVTSPGGTTAAALQVLMREPGGLQELMTKAVEAAVKRSRELGS